MSFPVFVHRDNGQFVATLVGVPDIRVTALTRHDVLAQMQATLEKHASEGELVFLDLPSRGIMAIAGKYRDDPTLQDICDEIYRNRDAEPKE
jgi:hypothetical protein